MAFHSVQGTHQQRRCEGQGRRPMAASINTSLFAPSKKITPRPPPSPRLRLVSFTTNVLGEPCVAAHTRQRQVAHALRGSVCREALASDALRFTRMSCQEAFDASNTTLTMLRRPRSAAAPVRILQPCGLDGGGAAQSAEKKRLNDGRISSGSVALWGRARRGLGAAPGGGGLLRGRWSFHRLGLGARGSAGVARRSAS